MSLKFQYFNFVCLSIYSRRPVMDVKENYLCVIYHNMNDRLIDWMCFTSQRQQSHLETAPPFTVPCEGHVARYNINHEIKTYISDNHTIMRVFWLHLCLPRSVCSANHFRHHGFSPLGTIAYLLLVLTQILLPWQPHVLTTIIYYCIANGMPLFNSQMLHNSKVWSHKIILNGTLFNWQL